MSIQEQLRDLLDKPAWTAQECRLVLDYLEQGIISELALLLRERFETGLLHTAPEDEGRAARLLEGIHQRIDHAGERFSGPPIPFLRRNRWWIAAAVILVIFTGGYVLLVNWSSKELPQTANILPVNDIPAPTGTRATLTLASGQTIALDSVQSGPLIQQGNAQVAKLANNQLAYHISTENPAAIVYNTLSTAKGGQTMVVLADGSKVWLNASSSISYPTAFVKKERTVKITGEAYFEIAKNPSQPFKVNINDNTEVEVLGTHFNVMAYRDESSIQTTLLEGSVKVIRGSQSSLLKPGQQAQLDSDGQIKVFDDADVEDAVAWKNGFFHFDRANIQIVMRELSRWYDIDVQFQTPISDHLYGGKILRNLDLFQVLDVLKTNNVHFRMEGKKIIVE